MAAVHHDQGKCRVVTDGVEAVGHAFADEHPAENLRRKSLVPDDLEFLISDEDEA